MPTELNMWSTRQTLEQTYSMKVLIFQIGLRRKRIEAAIVALAH